MDLLIFIIAVMLVIFAIFKIVQVQLFNPYMQTLADIYGLNETKNQESKKQSKFSHDGMVKNSSKNSIIP